MFYSGPWLAVWTLTAPLLVIVIDWVISRRQHSAM